MNNLISIVIPNYFTNKSGKIIRDNDEQLWFAEHCFERIKKYTTLPYELILIDNGSIHGQDLLRKYANTLITNKENLGFAKALNQGFNEAKGEWICQMNNDVFIWEGWLEALMKTFEDNPDCGLAMPALMKQTKNGKEALEFKKIDLSVNFDKYGEKAEFGSCWLTKKEILDKVKKINNGYVFDENFKVGFGEDRYLYYQIRKLGYETYRTHKTRVFHQGNCTMGKIENRQDYTIPNREYLRRITKLENEGRILSLEEKKQIREQVDIDYKKGLLKQLNKL